MTKVTNNDSMENITGNEIYNLDLLTRYVCRTNGKRTMTIKELALQIGCSRATLDRVLNNREGVGEKRRKEILEQVKEYGYKPNKIGKMLATQNRTVIGIILCADITPVENPLYHVIYEGMTAASSALEETGVRYVYRHIKSGKAIEQIRTIQELIYEERVSGIAISLEEKSAELYDTIQYHMDRGIRFLSYFNINGTQDSRFKFPHEIGINQQREGIVAAGLMAKFIGEKGKVVLMSGLEKNMVHQMRINSAKEMLQKEYEEIEVVEVIRNTYPEEKAVHMVSELIERHPDLNGIIMSCGASSRIAEKLNDMNKTKELSVISFDFTRQLEKDLEKGYLDAVIGVNLEKLGYKTIHAIYELVFQNEIQEDTQYIPLQIKIKESMIPI